MEVTAAKDLAFSDSSASDCHSDWPSVPHWQIKQLSVQYKNQAETTCSCKPVTCYNLVQNKSFYAQQSIFYDIVQYCFRFYKIAILPFIILWIEHQRPSSYHRVFYKSVTTLINMCWNVTHVLFGIGLQNLKELYILCHYWFCIEFQISLYNTGNAHHDF